MNSNAIHLDDNDVLALVSGTLPPERMRELDAHLDSCSDCRQLAAATAGISRGPGDVPVIGKKDPGAQQLGRYSVLEPVGAGAMGIVYAAYDPQLDRRVALKLLHASGGQGDSEKLRARLLREAQAMARLSHPNVIAVHDVGTVHDQVFVAMEFVEGETLSSWLEKKQPWHEILRVFSLSGRGLAAAHAAGLVHRDFKPDNVLIGKDGRVRVTDFGLASAEDKSPVDWNLATKRPATTSSLSQQGALVGSPAYMAPEQLRGETVDARADEFSFSVALYEALYGERPFTGADLQALRTSIEKGEFRAEPGGSRVPGWVRKVILRGLASDPNDRYPTLDAMLAALEIRPARARYQILLGLATLLVIVGSLIFLRWQSGKGERACKGADTKVENVWRPELKQAASQAFEASKVPYAQDAWQRAQKALDKYATDWIALRTEACEATAVRHEQSAELLDLRMSCFDDRLRELSAAASLFSRTGADPVVVAKSSNVTSTLTQLSICSDTRALREPGAPTLAQRPQVDALLDRIALVKALSAAGKPDLNSAQAISDDAKKLGYAPVEAEALLELGSITNQSGDNESAHKIFTAAAAAGLRAHTDQIVASGWIEALLSDILLSKLEVGDLDEVQARAAVARLGDDLGQQAALATALAGNARMHDHMDEATAQARRAVELLDRSHGDNHLLVSALGALTLSLESQSKMDEALATQERAWKLAVETYGLEHPVSAEMETEYGNLLCNVKDAPDCEARMLHAMTALKNALGPDHPSVADALVALADHSIHRDPKKAQGYFRDAIAVMEKGPKTSSLAYAHAIYGVALEGTQDLSGAIAEQERAIEIEHAVTGKPEDLETALARANWGEMLFQLGKLAGARAQLEQAIAIQDAGYGVDNPQTAETMSTLARVAYAEGKLGEARKLAEKVLAIIQGAMPGSQAVHEHQLLLARVQQETGSPGALLPALEEMAALPRAQNPREEEFDRDEATFLLGRALWLTNGDHFRAHQLAEEAHAGFVVRGATAKKQAAEVWRWLAANHI